MISSMLRHAQRPKLRCQCSKCQTRNTRFWSFSARCLPALSQSPSWKRLAAPISGNARAANSGRFTKPCQASVTLCTGCWDHSSLTGVRQCWGEDVFRRIFTRVMRQCQLAGLVSAKTVYINASLIRANVGRDALVSRYLDAERDARRSGKFKELCRTDPDASMATSSKDAVSMMICSELLPHPDAS